MILFAGSLILAGYNSIYAMQTAGWQVSPAEKVTLNPLFTDHMVLQRNQKVKIYGKATPGQMIQVTLGKYRVKTVSTPTGDWLAELPPFKAGGPYTLTIEGKKTIKLTDIMIGDVWLCSGQSNMEMPVQSVNNAFNEIKAADYPKLRLFTVKRNTSPQPLGRLGKSSGWLLCSPHTIPRFSAVAYFFGRELQKNY